MEKPLSALIAEDSEDDASTIAQMLQSDFVLRYEWVDNMGALARAASSAEWDVVVCDSSSFDVQKSMGLARQSGAHIFFIAEEDDAQAALSALRTGSSNILLKSQLGDLARRVKMLPRKSPSECAFFDRIHSTLAEAALITSEDCYSANEAEPEMLSGKASLDLIDMMCFDGLVQAVSGSLSDSSGQDFLQTLVDSLAQALGAERVFIGIPTETDRVRVACCSSRGDFECRGSPFVDVLSGLETLQSGDAGSIYPECQWLSESGSFYGFPLFDSEKKAIGLLAIADDLPIGPLERLIPILRILASRAASELELQHTRSLLRKSEEDFHLNFELVSTGMAHVSLDGKWLKANPALCRILECEEKELCSMRFHSVFHAEDLPKALELQASLLVGSIPSFSVELRFRKKNGQAIWVNLTLSILRDERNCPRHLVALIADISGRKRSEEQIHFLANHDTLTKLPNRNFLLEKLGNILAQAESSNQKLAILLLDLDRFKLVNDSLGHAAGDRLMSFCGQYIAGCLEHGDISARLGSDEFAIVCSKAETVEAISSFSEKILGAVATPTRMEDMDIAVTGCIGIAVYPDDGEDISTLLRKADAAMYCAKDAGGNHYRFYSDDMDVRTMDHLILVNDLRHAIEREEFVIHYQPQVDLVTGEMTAVEALLRWNHPKRGTIPPSEFIMLAEETGIIIPIGEWVLEMACRQARKWHDLGMENLRIAVNLSVRQFHKQNLVETVAAALNGSGLAPRYLELEITESAIMRNAEESVRTLQRLKEMGVRISIDDFGTGYSSLSYLKEFPIDKIKIDQSFVENIASSPDNAALANGIISLAHSIKLSVTAEGVENVSQLNLLSDSRCDAIQGFYFCTPLPAESLQKLIEEGKVLERLSA